LESHHGVLRDDLRQRPRRYETQRTFPRSLECCLSIEDANLLLEKPNLA
jgi:hypothetical protein